MTDLWRHSSKENPRVKRYFPSCLVAIQYAIKKISHELHSRPSHHRPVAKYWAEYTVGALRARLGGTASRILATGNARPPWRCENKIFGDSQRRNSRFQSKNSGNSNTTPRYTESIMLVGSVCDCYAPKSWRDLAARYFCGGSNNAVACKAYLLPTQ